MVILSSSSCCSNSSGGQGGILCLSGWGQDLSEYLPLTDKNTAVFQRLLQQQLPSLHRPLRSLFVSSGGDSTAPRDNDHSVSSTTQVEK